MKLKLSMKIRAKESCVWTGGWVWVYMGKENFVVHRKFKLQPMGFCPFQVISKINNNSYKK